MKKHLGLKIDGESPINVVPEFEYGQLRLSDEYAINLNSVIFVVDVG